MNRTIATDMASPRTPISTNNAMSLDAIINLSEERPGTYQTSQKAFILVEVFQHANTDIVYLRDRSELITSQKNSVFRDRYRNMKDSNSIVSHEMRTPLNGIVQLVDCIKSFGKNALD